MFEYSRAFQAARDVTTKKRHLIIWQLKQMVPVCTRINFILPKNNVMLLKGLNHPGGAMVHTRHNSHGTLNDCNNRKCTMAEIGMAKVADFKINKIVAYK